MPIPQIRTMIPVLLKFLADGKSHTTRALIGALAKEFRLKDEERKKLLPSGRQSVFESRVERAIDGLKYGALVDSDKKGTLKISIVGLTVLEKSPEGMKDFFAEVFGSSSKEEEDEEDMEEEEEALADEE